MRSRLSAASFLSTDARALSADGGMVVVVTLAWDGGLKVVCLMVDALGTREYFGSVVYISVPAASALLVCNI